MAMGTKAAAAMAKAADELTAATAKVGTGCRNLTPCPGMWDVATWTSEELTTQLVCHLFASGYNAGIECAPARIVSHGDPRLVEACRRGYEAGKAERLAAHKAARAARQAGAR